MSALVFLVPAWWPLLLTLPVALWCGLVLARARARRRAADLGGRADALGGTTTNVRLRGACAFGAAMAATLALLQPVWGEGEGEPLGPDVVLCLDVSRSMAARDVVPSRLAAAQQEIQGLSGAGTRLGLVAFAGEAHLMAPLSSDLPSVAEIARSMVAGTMGRGGTDLGAAIDASLAALQRAGTRSGAIVVLADGEDFAGTGPAAAARAAAAGVPVHCLGFGSEGGTKIVVEGDGGQTFLRDAVGADVVTRLERDQLAAMATAGGGRVLLAHDPGRLARLHDDVLLPAAVVAAVADPRRAPPHRFQWPLLAAVLLWMLRLAVPERRR